MLSLRLVSAVAAATLLSMASAQSKTTSAVQYETAPTEIAVPALTDIGCFNSSEPLAMNGDYFAQSYGNCKFICVYLGKNVMATSDGTKCWCGDLVPPVANKIDNSSCDTSCGGYPQDKCGGYNVFWVQLSGLSRNKIPNYTPSATPSATSMSTPTSHSTQKTSTTIPSAATETPSSASSSSGSPSKVGIAVGVVVGVLALAAIIGGAFLFLRHKRRREVEEEFRRQANMNSFTAGGKMHTSNSSMTDSRLDSQFMARRASNGSIADNEDYSRRILKVTNA